MFVTQASGIFPELLLYCIQLTQLVISFLKGWIHSENVISNIEKEIRNSCDPVEFSQLNSSHGISLKTVHIYTS